VVPCGLSVSSDPRLLEQMLRNLVSNALKYTRRGKILLGCRRHGDTLSIEVWDTGIGIPEDALEAIFEEYHQLDNVARERSRGLGLGLSIVHHLGALLGHPIRVRSRPGKGSVFSVEVALQPGAPVVRYNPVPARNVANETIRQTGTILVIEDDPDVREARGRCRYPIHNHCRRTGRCACGSGRS
jgi:two-component system CheB/CheR fusion protein